MQKQAHIGLLYFVTKVKLFFDSFGDEHVPKEIKKFVWNKNIIANIFQVQANDSIMRGYFCIGFIGIKYFLCSIDHFCKCTWVVPLKDKRGISIVNLFQQIVLKGHKPNKIWVDEGEEFYRKFFKGFLKINNNYQNFVFKHMTAISKNVHFDVLDDIINKYNNTVHRTIKMKPIDVTSDSYAEYNEDSNEKDPKFKVGDHVRISKYKNIFAK